MSVFSAKTGLSSILKPYRTDDREKIKNSVINKVRFEIPKQKGLEDAVRQVLDDRNYQALNDFIVFLKETDLDDIEFKRIVKESTKLVNEFSPKFTILVETLLSMPWLNRSPESIELFSNFYVDLLVAHHKYLEFGISKLITLMIPDEKAEADWINNEPSEKVKTELQAVHKILDRIMKTIPMSFDVVLDYVENKFPYFKRPTHVIVGYVYNLLYLLNYKPICTEYVIRILFKKLITLDVNAPRNEIMDAEDEDDDENDEEMDDENRQTMFTLEKESKEVLPMNHQIAHTLDMCMMKVFDYLDTKNPNALNRSLNENEKHMQTAEANKFLKTLLDVFDHEILPCHNIHHVQFVVFYYCCFKQVYAEAFLNWLWEKIKNPNNPDIIRQTAIGYAASFLARCKVVPLEVLMFYLKEFTSWAHNYIDNDRRCRNYSLKANLVFYSICQAVFYIIAFRSRDLTATNKQMVFLQNLNLSGLVNCSLNPLRVTLTAVATAFAGVTRIYQLAYCHAILESNARRKLATMSGHDMETPEETLDTFFPFDPYILKVSLKRIAPFYLEYIASEGSRPNTNDLSTARKRGDSEMIDDPDDDDDDFIIADKRQKYLELARSQERENQFNFGLSPNFPI